MTRRFIQDLKELGAFITSLFGLLALLSILLPIVNTVTNTIPLKPEFATLGTALAVIGCVFAFVYSFTEKSHLQEVETHRPFFRGEIVNPRREMLHGSVSRFGWGLITFAAYILISSAHEFIQGNAPSETAGWLLPIVEPLASIFYGASFALLTGAFGALAVIQHVKVQTFEAATGSINLGVRNTTRSVSGDSRLSGSSDGVNDTKH